MGFIRYIFCDKKDNQRTIYKILKITGLMPLSGQVISSNNTWTVLAGFSEIYCCCSVAPDGDS